MGEAEEVGGPDPRIDFERTEEERPRVLARDPVCGMDVDPEGAPAKSIYRGIPYFFCTQSCRSEFDANPTQYVG